MSYTVKKNGILLESEPDIGDIADAMNKMMVLSDDSIRGMREAAYNIWSSKFDAKKNATEFCEYLDSLCTKTKYKLLLVTNGYPFMGERCFIETEFVELVKKYDVTIIAIKQGPLSEEDKEEYQTNIRRISKLAGKDMSGLRIYPLNMKWSLVRFCVYLFKYFFDKRIIKERTIIKRKFNNDVRFIWESMKYYSKSCRFNNLINHTGLNLNDFDVLYTYWHLYSTLSFCLIKGVLSDANIITREHGYDLYDERVGITKRQPFRETMDEKLNGIVFACEHGRDYYIKRNGITDGIDKYVVGYLGTRIPNRNNYDGNSDVFRVVSCSNVIPLKRIELIIEALALLSERNLKKRIEWIHFGGGELEALIRDYAQKKLGSCDRITYSFRGKTDNDLIHEYYSDKRVDCFITTSSTEGGTPISIQEAMSYGIPIIATNVGGIKEALEE